MRCLFLVWRLCGRIAHSLKALNISTKKMVASLLKVISSGLQDERLSFRSTLFPFQKVWNKAGRFTTRWERLDFENTPSFGQTGFFRILRKGNLVTRLYLVAQMPDIYTPQRLAAAAAGAPAFPSFGWTNSLGHALVSRMTLDIGGSRVETVDGRLMEMLDEFQTPLEKVPLVNEMIRRKDNGFSSTSFGWPKAGVAGTDPYQESVVVPLPFWFTRGDPGCALPIDAISFDDVRVGLTFRPVGGLYSTPTHVAQSSAEDGASLWPLQGSSFYAADPVANPSQTPLSNQNGVITMPQTLLLGDCYIMAEYVYLDQNEANRFRLGDLQYPVVQHYAQPAYDTRGLPVARIRLDVPNPTRDLFFFCQPYMASSYNAHFLATRDLTGTVNTLPNGSETPWWPDAIGLLADRPSAYLRPGFLLSDAEPISGMELNYQGSLVRFRTEGCALFRAILPSREQRKAPWVNRYYYNIAFGVQNGLTPFSQPRGEANLDNIGSRDLVLTFRAHSSPTTGFTYSRSIVYVYAETYNMLRVYGGRAGLLFAY